MMAIILSPSMNAAFSYRFTFFSAICRIDNEIGDDAHMHPCCSLRSTRPHNIVQGKILSFKHTVLLDT